MSVLVVDHELCYSRFGEGEPLPSIWESPGVKLSSDDAIEVIAGDGAGVELRNLVELPPLPEVVEGIGFVILKAS